MSKWKQKNEIGSDIITETNYWPIVTIFTTQCGYKLNVWNISTGRLFQSKKILNKKESKSGPGEKNMESGWKITKTGVKTKDYILRYSKKWNIVSVIAKDYYKSPYIL